MPVTIAGKLKEPAREFQAGNSTGFGMRIGERYYDRETKDNQWTNYEVAVFASNPGQIDFYRKSLVAGAVVQVTGEQQKIKSFEGQDGRVHLSIDVLNCKLSNVFFDEASAPAQQAQAPAQQQQPIANQPPQQAYQAPPPQQNYQAAHSPTGNPPAGNGFAPSHPMNAQQQPVATGQETAKSPSSPPPAPEMDSFDSDIPF